MRKYGIQNFIFEILEADIPTEEELNEREKYYIQYYNSTSHNNGYNVALGGDGGSLSPKLSTNDVQKIRELLLDKNNIQSFNEIGSVFNITASAVGDINAGASWYDKQYDYPLRKYSVTGLTLTLQQYKEIVNLLQSSSKQLKDIMTEYNLSESQLSSINNGYYCYNGRHAYYKDIYSGPFPIRSIHKREKITLDSFIPMLKECIYSTKSMAQIGEEYGQEGNTLQYIFSGNRRKDLTANFIIPIRKHLEENKKIFESLYGTKKEV